MQKDFFSNEIISLTNNKIKNAVKLRNRKNREEQGVFIIDGVRENLMAVNAKIKFKEMYLCKDYIKDLTFAEEIASKAKADNVFAVNKKVFDKISFGNRKEGIFSICKYRERNLKDLRISKESFFIILENVEKPGNLGAIMRTAEGINCSGVLVCGEKESDIDIYSPNAIRASLGAVFLVDAVKCSNEEAMKFLKENNIKIYATVIDGEKDYFLCDFKRTCAIVIGSEDKGLTNFWINNSDVKVKIPMKGKIDSLNASVATSIISYECFRQRKMEIENG